MKSLKSSTPKLTTEGDANSYTLSVGQGVKIQMKKPLGYQQPNSIMRTFGSGAKLAESVGSTRGLQVVKALGE